MAEREAGGGDRTKPGASDATRRRARNGLSAAIRSRLQGLPGAYDDRRAVEPAGV
jgi:hypothetical protein